MQGWQSGGGKSLKVKATKQLTRLCMVNTDLIVVKRRIRRTWPGQ